MTWLNSIESLARILEHNSDQWICFLQYESLQLAKHPSASDHSFSSVSQPENKSDAQSEANVWVRCFFAARPRIECQEFVARDFFENPRVVESSAAAFLIPYYPPDEFEVAQTSPFLKFICDDFLELRGSLESETPEMRIQGDLFKQCLNHFEFTPEEYEEASRENIQSESPLRENRAAKNEWQNSESSDSLREMFNVLKKQMNQGECYLANASTRVWGPDRITGEQHLSRFVAQWLRAPTRYGVLVECGSECPGVVCFSPERFVARDGNIIQTEPIKGTAPIDIGAPALGANVLWESHKEMCEQKMISDLLRNDLNTVCAPGSVRVSSPFEMRVAGSLLQMQSVIRGAVEDPSIANSEILKKMLPAGSVTGTPKYVVGQQIRRIEKSSRGYYTGVFALADDDSSFDSTILIRGFFSDKARWYAGIGAGITTLSDVDQEVEEFQIKWKSFAPRWNLCRDESGKANPSEHEYSELNRVFKKENITRSGNFSKTKEIQNGVLRFGAIGDNIWNENGSSSASPLIELRNLQDLKENFAALGRSVLFVDHLDSFSENLIAAMRARGCSVARVVSFPKLKNDSDLEMGNNFLSEFEQALCESVCSGLFSALVLSPGPGQPADYFFSQNIITSWPENKVCLGVCLGHQLLLSAEGCQLQIVSQTPVHGRGELLRIVEPTKWLGDISLGGECTFYNSWCVSCDEFQSKALHWRLCAASGQSVALIEHEKRPWLGVQFHPESFASASGKALLDAFVALWRMSTIDCGV